MFASLKLYNLYVSDCGLGHSWLLYIAPEREHRVDLLMLISRLTNYTLQSKGGRKDDIAFPSIFVRRIIPCRSLSLSLLLVWVLILLLLKLKDCAMCWFSSICHYVTIFTEINMIPFSESWDGDLVRVLSVPRALTAHHDDGPLTGNNIRFRQTQQMRQSDSLIIVTMCDCATGWLWLTS